MYLNLDDSDLKKYVYRTISMDRLIELFKTGENTLVKPSLWEDTFENFVLKSKLKTETGEIIEYDVHDRLYGQCWTLEKSSDAMWRIYSQDKKGIRIRTTIGDLFDSLNEASVDTPKCLFSIGKVEYIKESSLASRANETFESNGGVRFGNLFKSLLIKRRAFKHENEVRLMFLDWSENAGSEKIYKYSINPHKLVSQMMIDPRVSYADFKKIEAVIREKTGYQGDIKRSLLYRLPKDLTINISE
ncbi:DUF2971 domain-containing protein [Photobacterium leiognathi]|uniref:DUF2971 domain-containing protein n=1 Tax=Photobacterium leiognathi TaxID=553611 RepID=UPI002981959F|nr:DUF2971 domain-containing protein [Photobacterium leiognathi]